MPVIKLIKYPLYKEADARRKLNEFVRTATQLSFGPECLKFEENFARHQKRHFCAFFNSGSSANLALIQALKNLGWLKGGDPV